MLPTEYRNEIFRAVLDCGPDSVILIDRDARIRYISKTAPGLTVEQVLGTPIYAYVPAAQVPNMEACLARVLSTGKADRFETRYEVDANTTMTWESDVTPIMRDGEVEAMIVVANDVTSQGALQQERDLMFQLSEDLLCVVGPEGRFTTVNEAWTRALGYSFAELTSRPFSEFIHPDDVEVAVRAFRTGDFDGPAGTNRFVHKDGSVRHLQWSGTSDVNSGLSFAAARDVTGQKALESQLRQSQKMDAVGQLAGGVAHDFNNLMQAVLGNVFFARSGNSDAELQGYLSDIEAAAERASVLTKQLLAFSRQQPAAFENVALNRLTRDFMRLLRRVIPKYIELEFVAGERLGVVAADRSQVEQVLMNLCLNSRDATSKGGRITIETARVVPDRSFREAHPEAKAEQYVRLSVTDTGHGMDADVCARVFEPFYSTKPTGQGTGLGLSVVYGIVQAHSGVVELESLVGKGTTFNVYLPIVAQSQHSDSSEETADVRTSSNLIVLAEDEELVRRVVVRFLEESGLRVLAAADGAEALRFCREHNDVALVILDVVMPNLSGTEAYKYIHESRPDLPVLFASGYHDRSRVLDEIPPDAPLLSKPFKLEDLLATVRGLLET